MAKIFSFIYIYKCIIIIIIWVFERKIKLLQTHAAAAVHRSFIESTGRAHLTKQERFMGVVSITIITIIIMRISYVCVCVFV